jgi:SAM-dependent methyltransferase
MSAKVQIKLTPEVLDILNRSEITATTLKLPAQLSRPLYVAVNKVIDLAGGKWNRGKACHVFKGDPREVLGLALESGEITDEKKLFQFYPTPLEAAKIVWELAEVKSNMRLLEPSAGDGGLLKAVPDKFFLRRKDIYVVELNPEHFTALHAQIMRISLDPTLPTPIGPMCPQDFLTIPVMPASTHFDRIVMNPPFTKGQAEKHVRHAWQFLKPGGRLVTIMPGGPSNHVHFEKELQTSETAMYELPEGTFKESGTNIKTTIVMLDK